MKSFGGLPAAAVLLVGALALSGCAATTTAVAKRNLDVQTKMTDTVFLEPVASSQKTVFVDIKNTSDKPGLDVRSQVEGAIAARGYKIVSDPSQAEFILQANVLQAGRSAETATQAAYNSGFGGSLVGGAVGAAAGYGIGKAGIGVNDTVGAVAGGLAGAAIESLSGAYVQDVDYSIITDIQISQRASPGVVVSQSETANLQQGSSGNVSQSSSTTTDMRRYRTRIVSSANQVNLDWPDAEPQLVAGLSQSIAGLF
ncbi:MAG: complement resistance protein TraT [Geminicoccaceae bacterium]